jgi:DNA-binding FadR family transcriptional regulator
VILPVLASFAAAIAPIAAAPLSAPRHQTQCHGVGGRRTFLPPPDQLEAIKAALRRHQQFKASYDALADSRYRSRRARNRSQFSRAPADPLGLTCGRRRRGTEVTKTTATTKASALADALVEDLERRVISGELPPGSRFPTEAAMVASHGVSRTVVREAFARLAAAGLLESRRGSGAYVAGGARYRAFQITADELREIDDIHRLFEMRTPLEIEMAALAAERHDKADIKAMKAAVDALLAADEVDAAVDADTAFHTAVARATRNDYFTRFTAFLGVRLVPPRTQYLRTPDAMSRRDYVRDIAADHQAILDAIARRDPQAARAAAAQHMHNSHDRHELMRVSYNRD